MPPKPTIQHTRLVLPSNIIYGRFTLEADEQRALIGEDLLRTRLLVENFGPAVVFVLNGRGMSEDSGGLAGVRIAVNTEREFRTTGPLIIRASSADVALVRWWGETGE